MGVHGAEPWNSRSAVECSTTELYPLAKKVEFDMDLPFEGDVTWRSILAYFDH